MDENQGKFDLVEFSDIPLEWPQHLMLYGPTMSGKTTILKEILRRSDFDLVIAFGSNVNELGINSDGTELIPIRQRFKRISKKLLQILRKTDKNQSKCVVFDDIMGETFDDDFWRSYISECRHDNISIIVSMQYITAIPPVFRANIHQIFITDCDRGTARKLSDLTSLTPNEISQYEFKDYNFLYIKKSYPKMINMVWKIGHTPDTTPPNIDHELIEDEIAE